MLILQRSKELYNQLIESTIFRAENTLISKIITDKLENVLKKLSLY